MNARLQAAQSRLPCRDVLVDLSLLVIMGCTDVVWPESRPDAYANMHTEPYILHFVERHWSDMT